jgi:hypothetical protein
MKRACRRPTIAIGHWITGPYSSPGLLLGWKPHSGEHLGGPRGSGTFRWISTTRSNYGILCAEPSDGRADRLE